MSIARILIVDDQEMVRDTLGMIFGKRPVEVDMAANGPEALHLLRGRVYDLILLDLNMPYMDGLDVLEQARLMSVDTSVIIFSGSLETDELPRAFRLGVVDFLPKPMEMKVILSLVDEVLQRSREFDAGQDPELMTSEARLSRAKALIQRRRFVEARALLPDVSGESEALPEALMLAGMLAEFFGDFDSAASAYKKTVKNLDPVAKSGCGWLQAG